MIDPAFLEILRCPLQPDGPPLVQRGDFLVRSDGCGYRVVDGIPRMLPDDLVSAEEIEKELNQA